MRTKVPKTKTFAGCWTCRRRKIKCDGVRPICCRCVKAKISCEGFQIELSWVGDTYVHPNVHSSTTSPSKDRRRITLPRGNCTLNYYSNDEANRMLGIIDDWAEDFVEPLTSGPFSVYRLVSTSIPILADVKHHTQEKTSQFATNILKKDNVKSESTKDETQYICDWHDSIDQIASGSRTTIGRRNSVVSIINSQVENEINHPLSPLTNSVNNNLLRICNPIALSRYPSSPSLAWIRRLMSHYISRTASLLQPIHHPKNPFISIYVRNAMAGSTALLFGTSNSTTETSNSSRAIFHSLIATSAFHLRGTKTDPHAEWALLDQIGRKHRLQSIKYLHDALSEPTSDTERYVTISATLSQVTIDIMEGSMSEYWLHLQGSQQLLLSRLRRLQQEPAKRQLDSISAFLSTIAETTNHRLEPLEYPGSDETNDGDLTTRLSTPFDSENNCVEFMYGVTPRLANYIHAITKLSRYQAFYAKKGSDMPQSLHDDSEELKQSIKSWNIESETFSSIDPSDSLMLSVAQNCAMSFHSAIQLYYHARVTPCSVNERASLSQDALDALEAAERCKRKSMRYGTDIMAPISWPAFIAACEAPENLHNEWQIFWEKLIKYRIGNLEKVWEVVKNVWIAKNEDALNESPSWNAVLRERDTAILAV